MATSKFKSMVMIKFQEINLFLNFIDYFCDGDKIEKHFMRVILKMTPRHAFVYQYRGYSLNEAGRLGVRWMKVNLPIFHAFWGQIFCPKTLDFHFPVIFSVENSLANYWSENKESQSSFDLFELKRFMIFCLLSQSVTRLVTPLLATTMLESFLWYIVTCHFGHQLRKIFARLNNRNFLSECLTSYFKRIDFQLNIWTWKVIALLI